MKSNVMFVDMQGFKDFKNHFILKELAIATEGYTQTFLVKPPYPYNNLTTEEKKHVNWIEKNRGIYWSEGYIDCYEFKRLIKKILENKKIIVKGEEKIVWLKNLCTNCEVVDIGGKGCPNLKTLYKKFIISNSSFNCNFHFKYCALKNVICLKKWYKENNMSVFNLHKLYC